MPRYRFSRLAAGKHYGIIGIDCGHDQFPLRISSQATKFPSTRLRFDFRSSNAGYFRSA
jgi:hypothetical protein